MENEEEEEEEEEEAHPKKMYANVGSIKKKNDFLFYKMQT